MNKKLLLYIITPIILIAVILSLAFFFYTKEENKIEFKGYWQLEKIYAYSSGQTIYEKNETNGILFFDNEIITRKERFDTLVTKKNYYYDNKEENYICWSDNYENVNSFNKEETIQEKCYAYEKVGNILSIINEMPKGIIEVYVYREITENTYLSF